MKQTRQQFLEQRQTRMENQLVEAPPETKECLLNAPPQLGRGFVPGMDICLDELKTSFATSGSRPMSQVGF